MESINEEDAYRELGKAIIIQALKDAKKGDKDANLFFTNGAIDRVGDIFGLPEAIVAEFIVQYKAGVNIYNIVKRCKRRK